MVIHSVTPVSLLLEHPESPEMSVQRINGGYIEGHNTPQGFRAFRLHATDPAMYLKSEYAPGSILRQQTHL